MPRFPIYGNNVRLPVDFGAAGGTIRNEGTVTLSFATKEYAAAVGTLTGGSTTTLVGVYYLYSTANTTVNVTPAVGAGSSSEMLARIQGAEARLTPLETGRLVPSGTSDDTALINARLTSDGSVLLNDGTYNILGVVNVPYGASFTGKSAGRVKLLLGASGQIRVGSRATANGSQPGATIGGFTIDGAGLANVTGGALFVGSVAYYNFDDVKVINSAGDGVVIEGAQNSTFRTLESAAHTGHCLVLDYGAGTNNFEKCEFALPGAGKYAVVFRQSGLQANSSQFDTITGPSANQFSNCLAEFVTASSAGMIYHGAGKDNRWIGGGVGANNAVIATPIVTLDHDANAINVTGTTTNLSNVITAVSSTANVLVGMAVRAPNLPPEAFVTAFTVNTITCSTVATATAAGVAVGLGAGRSKLSFYGTSFLGNATYATLFLMDGNCELGLYNDCVMSSALVGFRTRGSDQIRADNYLSVGADVTTTWVQVAGDLPAVLFGYVFKPGAFGSNAPRVVGANAAEPAFGTNWTSYGAGYLPARFSKDSSGRVHIEGYVKNTVAMAASATIFVMPAGYRPVGNVVCEAIVATGQVQIQADGQVVWFRSAVDLPINSFTGISMSFAPV